MDRPAHRPSRVRQALGRTLSDLGPPTDQDPSLSALLRGNLSGTLLIASAGWQVLMLIAVLAEPTIHLLLVVGHLAGLALALLCWTRRASPVALYVLVNLLFIADWTAVVGVASPLLFAACWMTNLATSATTVTINGRTGWILPLVAAVVLPVVMLTTRPDINPFMAPIYLMTHVLIVAVSRAGYGALVDFAADADTQRAAATRRISAAAAQRAAVHAAAEDARVLHDTLINTLAALASGGTATADKQAVRERCRSDLDRLRGVDGGSVPGGRLGELRTLGPRLGVLITASGMSDEELQEAESVLGPDVTGAIRLAAYELLQNSAKHAGCPSVSLEIVRDDDELVLTVVDEGRGFDDSLLSGRGLQHSVLERAETHGFSVHVTSSPGAGTRAVLRTKLGSTTPEADPTSQHVDGLAHDFRRSTEDIRLRTALIWLLGMTLNGLVLTATMHPFSLNAGYAMVVVATLSCLPAVMRARRGAAIRSREITLLLVGSAGAFICSGAAVDFGRVDPIQWQALGATAPLVLLIVLRPETRWVGVALLALLTASGSIALVVWLDSGSANALSPLIAATAGAMLVAGWHGFDRSLATLSDRNAEEQAASARAEIEAARHLATARAKDRLWTAVVDDSLDLLEAVINETADLSSSAFQASCAAEEAYLRQAILLNPNLVELGAWFTQAIGLAREREVALMIHTGDVDPDERSGTVMGRSLITLIETVPAHSKVTVTLYPTSTEDRLVVVAPDEHLRAAFCTPEHQEFSARFTELAEQSVVEIGMTGRRGWPEATSAAKRSAVDLRRGSFRGRGAGRSGSATGRGS